MADDLKHLRFHQALHGYADGHRLLASSASLKPRDVKAMLVMSDVSGPAGVIGDEGYLSGYPLNDSGVYAFACTWSARELPRPGCVWTHTILVDFADLAILRDMVDLVRLFRRPVFKSEFSAYERTLPFVVGPGDQEREDISDSGARRVLWALYEHPTSTIIASADNDAADIVLAIWAQQWPRLRRSFRFCTLSFGDRSTEGGAFDVQFIPKQERSVRLRFSDSIDADRQQPENTLWVTVAMEDLHHSSGGTLRHFLHEVGGDVTGGREAFAPLCELHYWISRMPMAPTAMDMVLGLLQKSFAGERASAVRTVILDAIVSHIQGLGGESAIEFVLENLESVDASRFEVVGDWLARVLWERRPSRLTALLEDSWPRSLIAERALTHMSRQALIAGMERDRSAVLPVLQRRRDLLGEQALWVTRLFDGAQQLRGVVSDEDGAEAVLGAILAAQRSDLARDVVRVFGGVRVLKELSLRSGAMTSLSPWIGSAATDSKIVAEFLISSEHPGTTFLAAIAKQTYPDSVPNDFGEDPWWTAIRNCSDDADEASKQYLCAYLLARALGYRSRNQAELIQYALDAVYLPALQSHLGNDAWNLLSHRLPDSWFFDWDKCRRIREAVVDTFVERNLSSQSFAFVTRDDRVFEDLARLAEQTGRGRKLLKRVYEALIADSAHASRTASLERILR